MSTLTTQPDAPPRQWTPRDLLEMEDAKSYELDGGRLEEKAMGTRSAWVGGEIGGILREFCREHRLGWVFPADTSYQCFEEDPGRVRRPDVSFIRFGRLPGEALPEGHTPIAPDLAVEVVSPHDNAYRLERKIEQYLRAGVRLVWVVNPDLQTVRVHRAEGSVALLHADADLSGEDVLPGFQVAVGSLFKQEASR